MQLSTKRFILRDFAENDIPAFINYHNDPRLRELYGSGENTPDHAAELIKLFISWADEQPRLNFQLAIARLDGLLVGCCGLRMKDLPPGKAELGVELAPPYWGKFGYATETMTALIDFGFNELGLDQILGKTVSANSKISRLATAFGAKAAVIDTPAWMAAKGWQQIQWQIDKVYWSSMPINKRVKRGA